MCTIDVWHQERIACMCVPAKAYTMKAHTAMNDESVSLTCDWLVYVSEAAAHEDMEASDPEKSYA